MSSYREITQQLEGATTLPPERKEMTLQVVQGEPAGAMYVVESDRIIIGRGDDADIVVPDGSLSRRHACFLRRGDSLLVADMESLNGTLVEGRAVRAPVALQQGDRICLGRTTLRFMTQDTSEVAASQHLYDAAVRDRLTGLFNRGYLEDRLAAEFAYAKRHASPLSLLLLDLDHFKQINDTHGHPVGDALLAAVAAGVRRTVRREDVAARYGGEELAVLARGIPAAGAGVLGQRLRALVARTRVANEDGEEVGVTVSIGVAVYHPASPIESSRGLLVAADRALYGAKRTGRDQVMLDADPASVTEPFQDG